MARKAGLELRDGKSVSAWIETLFDAPLNEARSWKAMHEVLRDPSRNLLFNHLGLREDQKGLVIQPDCADVPYFLRAYFAFKMGLPFGYANARAATTASLQMYTMVEHCERGAAFVSAAADKEAATPVGLFGMFGEAPSTNSRDEASPQAARARAGLWILSEDDHCQCRPLLQRANRGG